VLSFTLASCGVAYVSPQVEGDAKVRVTQLTAQTVLVANRESYQPRNLPNPFFQAAGTGAGQRAADIAPLPSLSEQRRPSVMASRIPANSDPGPYQLGVGDVVLLATRTQGDTVEELGGLLAAQNSRQGYTIQDDGAIAVPDVGRIQLADLTLEEAETRIFQSLVESQLDPTFSLELVEFNSQRVSLGGAVGSPTVVPITLTPLHLDEALGFAGGIATPDIEFASIRIYRGGILYQIPLERYLREPALQKTRLIAGDSVFVDTEFELDRAQAYFEEQIQLGQFRQQSRAQALTQLTAEVELRRAALAEERSNFQERIALDAVERDYVYLVGEVSQPGRFVMPFERQTKLADALFDQGGFEIETGNPAQIYVLRASDDDFGAITAWHLDGSKVANLVLATQMNLVPNDLIFIAEQPVTRWNRVVQQLVPSLIISGATLATN